LKSGVSFIMGAWTVIEYDAKSGRKITGWTFPSFPDAETFRHTRKEFYESIGVANRELTRALPRISEAEMELFEKIIQNPEWMSRIMHQMTD